MPIAEDKAWQPPPRENRGRDKVGWVNDVVAAGEGYMSRQPGFKDMTSTINLISGRLGSKISESRSHLDIPRDKRALREVVSGISDVRTVDGIITENKNLQPQAELFNKVWKAIYFESRFSKVMKTATQWMISGGVSYISPVYRNLRLSSRFGKGLAFDAFPISDCLPFQLPMNNDVQGAYAWTIIRFMPTFEAHAKFPVFQHLLRPIARRRYTGNAAKDRLALAERFRADAAAESGTAFSSFGDEFNEIRYTIVNDLSINNTLMPVAMGVPGSMESYIVPYLGQEIPTGEWNRGVRIMRKAEIEDCYLYPNKRLIITQRGMGVPLYDGPYWDWHGMFPLVRLSADEWPWEPGYSLARDILSIGETQRSLERGIDQTAKQRVDPALMYDKTAINRKTAEQFDPYEERARLGVEGGISETTVKTALPPELMNMPGWIFQYHELLENARDKILGTDQMSNLAKAKLSAATGEVLQEALEEAGPIVKDISHGLEYPMADLMWMCIYNILQYYPTGRIMTYVGADGVTRETFDLNPSELIPDSLSIEVGKPAHEKSAFTRMQRVQMYMANFKAIIAPGSLHGQTQTAFKLLLMQLQRSGFMISSETVARAMDIPNWGSLEGNTEVEKWQSEQKMKLEFAEKLKELQAGIALQAQGPSAPPQTTPLAPGAKPQPGRPPSGQHAPELKTKGSAEGPRAVVSESG